MVSVFHTHNPRTSRTVATFTQSTPANVDTACRAARAAQSDNWRSASPTRRAAALLATARVLREQRTELARAEAADTGKFFAIALKEVDGAIALWEYAAHLARTASTQVFATGGTNCQALTVREPMGVVGMIVPWNYPLITTSERMPFALAAGCGVVLKPSETAAGSLPALTALIAAQPEIPRGLVQTIFGDAQVGQSLCEHPLIDMISFVGSTGVGRAVEACAVNQGKRVSAEMGGNNFVLVYADADLDRAADAAIVGAFRNAGQACIAGTHVLVESSVEKAFTERLVAHLQRRYPPHGRSAMQPLITPEHAKRIESLVTAARNEGLALLAGSSPERRGNRIGPVIFERVPPQSILFREEIFGPVMTVTPLNAAQFIAVANGTGYGLAAYAWTGAAATARSVIATIRAGRIWINTDPESWLPELPAGGFGASGTGRELGPHALETYSLPKSVLLG